MREEIMHFRELQRAFSKGKASALLSCGPVVSVCEKFQETQEFPDQLSDPGKQITFVYRQFKRQKDCEL